MENWKTNKAVFWVLSLPGTFWLAAFFIAPLALIWALSFGEKTGIITVDITWTLDNYIRSFETVYLEVIWKSVWVSVLATVLCLMIAYPIAFVISFAPAKWKPLMLLAVILPFWINLLIRTYALIAVFRTRGYVNFGLEWVWEKVNAVLNFVGLEQFELIGARFEPLPLLYNNFAVIAGLVYVFMPFMVLPLYANIEKLDKSYLEASLDLGASQLRTFASVVVPLTMPGIISGIILVFIPCLGSFLTPDLLGGTSAQMIGNVIERQFKAANDWPFGAALSFLLMYVTFGALALRSVLSGRQSGMEI
jgi:spermidine/putrescine transport system permease protein